MQWSALFDLALAPPNTYLSVRKEIRPKDNSEKEPAMADVLTTGALFSAPTKKSSFFARLLRAHLKLNQRRADRVVAKYIATHGLQRLSDDAERQINDILIKSGHRP
jgi:hypothetical protein